jgi:hypothetical protein
MHPEGKARGNKKIKKPHMKTGKTLFAVIITFCSILTAGAQTPGFSLGVKAGLGIPNLTAGTVTTPLSEDYASRLGLYTGIVAEYQTKKWFGLRAELNYSSKGGQRNGMQALPLAEEMLPLWQMLPLIGIIPEEYMYADIKSEAILNYIEIPVLAKSSFRLGSKINFYLEAGPYIGFILEAENITSGSSGIHVDKAGLIAIDDILELAGQPVVGSVSFDHNQDITNDVNTVNFGGQGAVGFEYEMNSGKLFIEGGGNYGFIPIQKDKANGSNNAGAGTVTLGYLFNL